MSPELTAAASAIAVDEALGAGVGERLGVGLGDGLGPTVGADTAAGGADVTGAAFARIGWIDTYSPSQIIGLGS